MNSKFEDKINERDPLGLRDLPQLDPPTDDWNEIRAALEADRVTADQPSTSRRWIPVSLAAAASIALAILVVIKQPSAPTDPMVEQPTVAMTAPEPLDVPGIAIAGVGELVDMSQLLERRLKYLRDNTGAIPAQSAVYVAELEDMIAQVDGEISFAPESVDLWGQRVNLLLDLEFIYQHQFELEYGRMASL